MSSEATPAPADRASRRIRQFEVSISEIVVETPDTVTLVMTGPERFEYKAGQFCTIDPHQFHAFAGSTSFLEDLKHDKEPPRAY
jgi:NAD(P)H-flavin reductase